MKTASPDNDTIDDVDQAPMDIKVDIDDYGSLNDEHIVSSAPSKFRSKASQLVQCSRHSGIIIWNKRGEVKIDGVAVRRSHILDLINGDMRNRKIPSLMGSKQFPRAIRRMGIPREFMADTELWTLVCRASPTKPTKCTEKPRGKVKAANNIEDATDESTHEKKESPGKRSHRSIATPKLSILNWDHLEKR